MATSQSPRLNFILALSAATAVGIGLFGYGAYRNHSLAYDYLIWNLVLAAIPLVLAVRLTHVLRRKLWSSWEALIYSLLWLLFVPNSFYMVSDFIHLREVQRVNILYDAVMFACFIYIALVLGFASLYLVHSELRKRLRPLSAAILIALTLLIGSFAIYIGRDLRWNSWDVIFNPGGLLFDLSDRFLHPRAYPDMFRTVIIFFALLSSLYAVVWESARLIRLSAVHELAERVREHRH